MGAPMAVTFILLAGLAAIVSAGGSTTLSQAQKCKLLDDAIYQFLANKLNPDMFILFTTLTRESFDETTLGALARTSGVDLLENSLERHQLACRLVAARSREEVGEILGLDRDGVSNLYIILTYPLRLSRGIEKLDEITKVIIKLLTWQEDTGYPFLPLRNLDEETSVETFTELKEIMKIKFMHDNLIDGPWPVKVSPQKAYRILKESKTPEDIERRAFINPGSLQSFGDMIKETPGGVTAWKNNVRGTFQFLSALERTGVLRLK